MVHAAPLRSAWRRAVPCPHVYSLIVIFAEVSVPLTADADDDAAVAQVDPGGVRVDVDGGGALALLRPGYRVWADWAEVGNRHRHRRELRALNTAWDL
jgi:hypothetical protein